MLFKISIQNLKKSVKDYVIYFVTLIFGVAYFYIFNAISTQAAAMQLSETKSNIIQTMDTALSAMSVLVSFILGFLIVYASRFLIRKRKKEFGVYLTLGMRRKHIARILLGETVIIGVISLVVGLAGGIILSQFVSLAVANLFQANMEAYVFLVSIKAIKKTILYFVIIYAVVIVMNLVVVNKSKLIDLMNAGKKGEKTGLQNPILSTIIFLGAAGMLGYAYYHVTSGAENLVEQSQVILQIVLGIVGTFLIFWSVSGMATAVLHKLPGIYHRKLNNFVYGEVKSQVNTTVVASSIICLLLFFTICILSSCFTLKDFKENVVEELAPASVSISKGMEEEHSLEEIWKLENVDITTFQEYQDFFTYKTSQVTMKHLLGEYAAKLNFGETFENQQMETITVSDYNKAARIYHFDEMTLADNEYAIAANYDIMVQMFNTALQSHEEIVLNGKILTPGKTTCSNGFLMMTYNHNNMGIVVVPDSIEFTAADQYKNYNIINFAEGQEKTYDFKKILQMEKETWGQVDVSTKTNIYDDSIGSSGMIVFVGLYLGIICIIAGAALLALKEMSDAIDDREKYQILRKIGTREKDIQNTLLKKMAVFFGLPLILAIIHSIFGIQVCRQTLDVYNNLGIVSSLTTTAVLIVLIYGGYFMVTYFACKRIIK